MGLSRRAEGESDRIWTEALEQLLSHGGVGLGHWFWVLPDSVRRVVSAIYSFFENSMPAPVLRVCGVFGTLAGLGFIYVGVYIV